MQHGTGLALAAALALGGFWVAYTYLEVRPFQRAMERARVLSRESRMHDLVLFEGTVEPAGDVAAPGRLAMGFEERVRHGKRVHWKFTVYRPRFRVMAQSVGAVDVVWKSLEGAPLNYFPGRPRRRSLGPDVHAVGLDAGDTISCLATVVEAKALVLSATEWGCFAGTLNEFRSLPAEQMRRGLMVAALSTGGCSAVIGLILFASRAYRRLSS